MVDFLFSPSVEATGNSFSELLLKVQKMVLNEHKNHLSIWFMELDMRSELPYCQKWWEQLALVRGAYSWVPCFYKKHLFPCHSLSFTEYSKFLLATSFHAVTANQLRFALCKDLLFVAGIAIPIVHCTYVFCSFLISFVV